MGRWIMLGMLLIGQLLGMEVREVVLAENVKKLENGTYDVEKALDTFRPTTRTIHALFRFRDAKKGTVIRIVWIAEKAEGVKEGRKIVESSLKLDRESGVAHGELSRGPVPLPVGEYRVELRAGEKALGMKRFSIREDQGETGKDGNASTGPRISTLLLCESVESNSEGMLVPKGIGERFPSTQPSITVVGVYEGLEPGAEIGIVWSIEEGGKMTEAVRDRLQVDRKKGAFSKSIQLNESLKTWPTGTYRVEIYSGKKRLASKTFEVYSASGSCGDLNTFTLSTKAWIDKEGLIQTEGEGERFLPQARKLYAVVSYKNAKKGTRYLVKWFVVKAAGVEEQKILEGKIGLDRPDGAVYAEIEMERDWPPGAYRVELWCGDKVLAKKSFLIVSGSNGKTEKRNAMQGCGKLGQSLLARRAWADENRQMHFSGEGDRFPVTQRKLFFVAEYSGAVPPKNFEVRWIAERIPTIKSGTLLMNDTYTYKNPAGVISSTAVSEGEWDPGVYRVEVWCGERKMLEKRFTMVRETPTSGSGAQNTTPGPLAPPPAAAAQNTAAERFPIGRWRSEDGSVVMEIPSPTLLIYGGRRYPCTMNDREIVVMEGLSRSTYTYRRSGDRLVLRFPNGTEVGFRRIGASAGTPPPASAPAAPPATAGEESLVGRFCCMASEGNEWIRFKRGGAFEYGHLDQPGVVRFRGLYRLEGDRIVIDAGQGVKGTAKIGSRDPSGRVEGFVYEGIRYTRALCP